MKILLINHYAGSEYHGMEYRPFYLAREWVKLGHDVKIVSASFSHLRNNNPNIEIGDYKDQIFSGINFRWFLVPIYKGNGLKRILNIFTFLYRLFKHGKNLAEEFQPDVVIASSTYPMDIWPAHRIAKLAGAKLVFEIHDLWPLSPIELGGYSKKHPYIILVQAAENFAYRKSDSVVSILPKVLGHVSKKGFDIKKLHIIPNGIVPEDFKIENQYNKDVSDIEKKILQLKESGYFIVGYAGSHGLPNNLSTLLKAAQIIKNKKLAFILIGSGAEKDNLIKMKEHFALKNVYFYNYIDKCFIPRIFNSFDIGYIGWRKQPLYRFGISPNKLMDYMMAELPILHSVEAGNDPVAEANCGISVAAEDPNAIASGVIKFYKMSDKERKTLGKNGKNFVMDNRTYRILAKNFINALI